jgi:ABC-2 type transport system permease protein
MIAKIARKEFTEMIRDGRYAWAAGIVFCLLAVALFVGWKSYAAAKEQRETARQEERARWVNQGTKNPHSATHYGVYAFKPELPLAAFDQGLNPYTGVTVWLEAHRQNQFKFRPAEDATAVERFGELTAAATLQVLIPLLIVLLLYASFAGEREQGTLRLLMSLGVPRRTLALGKALGAAGALGALLAPAAVVGAGAMMLFAGARGVGLSAGRMLTLALCYVLYFGVVIGVSLIVSARAKSSQLALVVLLAAWFVNSFVAPRVVSDAAKWLHPTPSAFDFALGVERDTEKGLDGHSSSGQRLDELKRRTLRKYGVKTVEELPVNFSGIQLSEADEYGYQVYDKHYDALFAAYERQNATYQTGAVAAPMLAVQSVSMGLAGTDFAQHRDFTARAEEYRRSIQKLASDAIINNSRTGDYYVAGGELWGRVPPFEYDAPGLGWVLGNHWRSLLLLALWFAAVCVVTPVVVARVRVD